MTMAIGEPPGGDNLTRLPNEPYEENDTADWAVTSATIEQLNEMLTNICRELLAGALGIT